MNTITFKWADSPTLTARRVLAWVFVGQENVGMLSLNEEQANEVHNLLGDGQIVEEGWENVLL